MSQPSQLERDFIDKFGVRQETKQEKERFHRREMDETGTLLKKKSKKISQLSSSTMCSFTRESHTDLLLYLCLCATPQFVVREKRVSKRFAF